MILAVKCPPDENVLSEVCRAGLEAAELYLPKELLNDMSGSAQVCKNFPLRYAIHALNDEYAMEEVAELAKRIRAEVVVFHNIYWEDEWEDIVGIFKNIKTKLCVENVQTVLEPLKFMRRYGLGRCLDLEHLQLECAGIYTEEFLKIIKKTYHVHLTGYVYGSQLWHTHIHHSPQHSLHILDLLKKADYSGFVVSEARSSLQTYSEFKELNRFFQEWKNRFNKSR